MTKSMKEFNNETQKYVEKESAKYKAWLEKNKNKIYALYKIEWTEYERGWGQRPDGETFHLSLQEAEKFAKDYNEKYNNEDVVPDCYSKPGKPELVEVTKEFHEEFMARIAQK